MKKTLLLIFTLISIVKFNSFSQDIIYNITTKSQDKGSYLDSIHFRNLTNNNVLKLNDLPNDDFLTINLTTGNINTNVTNSFIGSSVEIQNSQPGIFTIFYRGLQSKNFLFELYNLAGQLVYCRNVFVRPNHQINIYP